MPKRLSFLIRLFISSCSSFPSTQAAHLPHSSLHFFIVLLFQVRKRLSFLIRLFISSLFFFSKCPSGSHSSFVSSFLHCSSFPSAQAALLPHSSLHIFIFLLLPNSQPKPGGSSTLQQPDMFFHFPREPITPHKVPYRITHQVDPSIQTGLIAT